MVTETFTMYLRSLSAFVLAAFLLQSCQKEKSSTGSETKINFTFRFDSAQARLNNIGQAAAMPPGNAGQSPRFNSMSAHYVELTKDQFTGLGAGAVLFHAPEVTTGGATAIDFTKAVAVGNNEVFLSMPLSSLPVGTYNWLRVSLAYQNFNVYVNGLAQTVDATIASFIGFNTYIPSFKVKDSTVSVNANKAQGFWAVEASAFGIGILQTGQAPPGATTVPNPIFATSPIPQGSCVVTRQFATPVIITGNETTDINIRVSVSTNKSFEWKDLDGNGKFDPSSGDQIVDMGIRGMIPTKL